MKCRRVLAILAASILLILVLSSAALAASGHVSVGNRYDLTGPTGFSKGTFVINATQINANGGAVGHLMLKYRTVYTNPDLGLYNDCIFSGKVLYMAIDGNEAWLGGEFTRAREVFYYDDWLNPVVDPIVNDLDGWQFVIRVQDNGTAVPDLVSHLWFDDLPGFAATALAKPNYALRDYEGWRVRIW